MRRWLHWRVWGLLLLLLVLASSAAAQDIISNRVLYLRLNEGTGGAGTSLTDSGTGAHTCTLDATNFPDWLSGASCKEGACLSFNGTNDRVSCADATDLSPTNGTQDTAFSVTLWAYITNLTTYQVLLGKGLSGNIEWFVLIDSGSFYTQIYTPDASGLIGRLFTLSAGAHQNQWIHIAWTYNGNEANNGHKIYVNAVQVDTADGGSGTHTGNVNGPNVLEIGNYDTNTAPFAGRMDELKIFTRELTQGDVTADFNALTAGVAKRKPIVY